MDEWHETEEERVLYTVSMLTVQHGMQQELRGSGLTAEGEGRICASLGVLFWDSLAAGRGSSG